MNDPVALMLQLGFLAVLYLFLFWIARSAVKDLSRREVAPAAPAGAPPLADEPASGPAPPGDPRLVVVTAMGLDPGTELPVGDGVLLGRSPGADIRIDDQFASSNHARVYAKGGEMVVEDLGSTNGTYLNSRPLRGSERLGENDTIRIGDTEFRYRS
jgi:hypothetical protein